MQEIYMVAESDCPFGAEVISEVMFFDSPSTDKKQIVAFDGVHYYKTENDALREIEIMLENGSQKTFTIVKMYTNKKENKDEDR